MNEELIGQILNDPEKMAQLSALAESFGLNGAPPEAGRARPNQDLWGDADDNGRPRAVFP